MFSSWLQGPYCYKTDSWQQYKKTLSSFDAIFFCDTGGLNLQSCASYTGAFWVSSIPGPLYVFYFEAESPDIAYAGLAWSGAQANLKCEILLHSPPEYLRL